MVREGGFVDKEDGGTGEFFMSQRGSEEEDQ